MIENKCFVIFGYPRSATKLLANVLTQSGCHNYGEWYDVWSSYIEGNHAVRLDKSAIKKNQETLRRVDVCRHTIERHNQWLDVDKYSSWTITIWPDNLRNFPFLLQSFQNCHWFCTQRNKWDQYLSWIVSRKNQNYNSLYTSDSVTVTKDDFHDSMVKMTRAKVYQEWILKNLSSSVVLFDDLVSGNFNIGYDYQINTKDEHTNIENYIINIDEVKDWYNELHLT